MGDYVKCAWCGRSIEKSGWNKFVAHNTMGFGGKQKGSFCSKKCELEAEAAQGGGGNQGGGNQNYQGGGGNQGGGSSSGGGFFSKINDNWMPYPSEKFKDGNAYIDAYKKFIQTGILPFLFFFISILYSCSQNNSHSIQNNPINNTALTYDATAKPDSLFNYFAFNNEYQFNELLFDKNDSFLMEMDTTLYFSDQNNLFEVSIKNEKIEITCKSWKQIPDNLVKFKQEGVQKNGFIYIKNKKTGNYEMGYKIILNKGLFFWSDNHWYLLNNGNY